MSKKALPKVSAKEIQRRIGNNLRRLRHEAGLSQKAAADLADSDPTYLSQLELGNKNVTIETIIQFANAYGVSVVSLLVDDEDIIALAVKQVAIILHDELQTLLDVNGGTPPTASALEHTLQQLLGRFVTGASKHG